MYPQQWYDRDLKRVVTLVDVIWATKLATKDVKISYVTDTGDIYDGDRLRDLIPTTATRISI